MTVDVASAAFVALFLLTVIGHASQSLLGFGASFIPIAVGAALFPVPELKLVVVVLNLPTALWMVLRDRGSVDVRRLAWPIVPLAAVGLAAGLVAVRHVDAAFAKRALGGVVVLLALHGLSRALRPGPTAPDGGRAPAWTLAPAVVGGGALQGAWAAGIPLLVLGLLSVPWERRARLASVGALCVLIYTALGTVHVVDGTLGAATWRSCAKLLPAVLLGLVAGELLRDRIPERPFRVALFALLVAAGLVLVVTPAVR